VKVFFLRIRHYLLAFCVCTIFMGGIAPLDFYVDERTRTEIFFSVQEPIFPGHWYGGQIRAEVEPLSRFERLRMIRILGKAFEKYPDRVISENLERVYALRSMRFYGVAFGGTHSGKTVYLCDEEDNPYFTDSHIEGIFHHEFSSILKRTHPGFFNLREWEAVNAPGFKYGNGGVNAIQNGQASVKLDPACFNQGFLSRYSKASPEEDLNVFSQYLFTGNDEFWTIVDNHPRIHKKAMILIGFYRKINPLFTEDYFRRINNRQAAGIVKNEDILSETDN